MATQANASNPDRMAVVDGTYIDPTDRMDPAETATLIGVLPGTLALWRCTGRGNLPFTKCGRKIYYSRRAVATWLAARTGTSNAQVRAAISN